MIRLPIAAVWMAVGLASVGAVRFQQPAGPVVSVDVLVTTADGTPVPALRAEDFELVTGAYTPPIVSFAVGKQPLTIVFLVDVSASVTARLPRDVLEEDVEKALIDVLQAGEQLRIGGFGKEIVLNSGLSSNRRQLRGELRSAISHRREDLFGPSPIWDATYQAIESFPPTEGRRVLILLTDGRATGNVHSVEEVARAAAQNGIAIHIVGQDREYQLRQDATTAVAVRPGNALRWLADVTGGQFISGMTWRERGPARALTQIMTGLRQTYTLAFEAPVADGRLHPLEVRVRRANVKVRGRSLYVAPKSGVRS